jgi:sigma-B regulation protein RsbQ
MTRGVSPVSLRNNVNVFGKGTQPMLFAHGYGCDQTMWRLVTPAFEDEYKIVLFDHVGAGRSDLKAYNRGKYRSLRGYADDIVEICTELELKDVLFVGHSVSATIGILAAIKRPDLFDRLILIGPSPCYIDSGNYVGGFTREQIDELLDFQDSNFLGWSSTFAPIIMGTPDQPELIQELTNSFCRTDPDIAKQFAAVTFLSDNRGDLEQLQVPALILQCRQDAIAPVTVGEYVHQHLPGSEFVILDATGHCPHLSSPDQTVAAMKAYLGR